MEAKVKRFGVVGCASCNVFVVVSLMVRSIAWDVAGRLEDDWDSNVGVDVS